MAVQSWSNPNQDEATSAKLSAPFHVDAASIAGVVNAIMDARAQADKQKQDAFDNMLGGISKGVGSIAGAYVKNQNEGERNDAANRAMYLSQNPQGDIGPNGERLYGDALDARVPDYGGYDAIRTQNEINKAMDARKMEQLKEDYLRARTAHAWNSPSTGGSSSEPNTWEDPVTHERFLIGPRGGARPLHAHSGSANNPYANPDEYLSQRGIDPGQYQALSSITDDMLKGGGHIPGTGEQITAAEASKLRGAARRVLQQQGGGSDTGAATREAPYASEQDARAAGHESGDRVLLWDDATKRYRPAILN